MKYSPEYVKVMIATNIQWLYHAITAIYKRQTDFEQSIEATCESNGVGFNSCDAKRMSEYAQKLLQTGKLSEKERYAARVVMLKYSGQLARIANEKEK